MKIALVYDRVNKWGGAERILLALHKIWPQAPLYTSVYDRAGAFWAKDFDVRTSFLQNFPLARSNHEFYPWLMPLAFESFNFDEYDIVISITSEAAKGIITKPQTLHICYCLTPTRYLWSGYKEYFKNSIQRLAASCLVNYLRKWDKIACQRPDYYFAISKTVQERIKKYYNKESEVIYPPIDINKFQIPRPSGRQANFKFQNSKYFLVVSRLVSYKRIDIAIEAFNKLGWNLKIVGTGRELGRLRKMARKNIEFLGQLTEEQLISYYQNCQAVIFPQEEDFGLVPLEAQACGKPVIAYKGGGVLETVKENVTGEFFYPQSPEALIEKLKDFREEKFSSFECRRQAERFSLENFLENFKKLVELKWKKK